MASRAGRVSRIKDIGRVCVTVLLPQLSSPIVEIK